mgnify:CR=1 FL=1
MSKPNYMILLAMFALAGCSPKTAEKSTSSVSTQPAFKLTIVPYEAAAPALVIVGFLMMTQIRKIDFNDYTVAIPAFLTVILMPFTYSITNGIGAGIVTYVLIKVAQRKSKDIGVMLWVIAAAFTIYFAVHPIKELLNIS